MNHRPRITLLVLTFLALCVLIVMLFASLPARTIGPHTTGVGPFGPDSPKIDLLSCRVTDELDPTLTLVFPKTEVNQ